MTDEPGGVELSMDELRAVARHAAESALDVLPLYERDHPDDGRPRAAVEAAMAFAAGARRSGEQRTTALAAHAAAKTASTESAREAARAAAHAAAAAYLHPLARATQVKHILGAAAHAARAAEVDAGGDEAVGELHVELARRSAGPTVAAVLRRYPPAPSGRTRTAQLLRALDRALRT